MKFVAVLCWAVCLASAHMLTCDAKVRDEFSSSVEVMDDSRKTLTKSEVDTHGRRLTKVGFTRQTGTEEYFDRTGRKLTRTTYAYSAATNASHLAKHVSALGNMMPAVFTPSTVREFLSLAKRSKSGSREVADILSGRPLMEVSFTYTSAGQSHRQKRGWGWVKGAVSVFKSATTIFKGSNVKTGLKVLSSVGTAVSLGKGVKKIFQGNKQKKKKKKKSFWSWGK